jgi:hypothetical protein
MKRACPTPTQLTLQHTPFLCAATHIVATLPLYHHRYHAAATHTATRAPAQERAQLVAMLGKDKLHYARMIDEILFCESMLEG